ncbi:MAG: hypothetical protein JST54_17165 [Deltaproteobacteria bacterium]|nr:hypothetical protein [Deltaproteobacteria bacterium]
MRRLALFALLLAGCGTDFAPQSQVAGFRVLGMRADPPDLHPGDTANLASLVVDPGQPGLPITMLYLACDPDPTGLGSNPCSQYQTVADAQGLFVADGGLPPGAHFLGINTASYTAPAGLFDAQPANAVTRQAGVLAVVLGVALGTDVSSLPQGASAAQLFQLVVSKQIPSQLVIKRLRVSEEPNLNHNPELGLVATDTDEIRPEHPLLALPGTSVPLFARASSGAHESYVAIGLDGTPDPRTETAAFSWFTSAGSLAQDRTTDNDTTVQQFLNIPDGVGDGIEHVIPGDRHFTLWVVVRDGRGGEDWQALPGIVCDPSAPAATLSAAQLVNGEIFASGDHLDAIIDATLDGQPILGSYQSSLDAFVGRLPAGAQGTHTLEVRDLGCHRSQATLTVP